MELNSEAAAPPSSLTESRQLDSVESLTRQELMSRRATRLSRLAKRYRRYYWLLTEDVRRKHRDFVWKFGNNNSRENDDVAFRQNGVVFADHVNNNCDDGSSNGKLGLGLGLGDGGYNRCFSPNCRFKAMALTNYCLSHILSDSKQVLYTGCQYPHKLIVNSIDGPLRCMTPVLRSTVPPLCSYHLKIYEQQIRRDLKKCGASAAASNKLASKFHLVLTEYVRLIQTRRRAMRADNLAAKGTSA
ncbi:hypothetical protein vseg_021630 [Gypsophila vaccaria]